VKVKTLPKQETRSYMAIGSFYSPLSVFFDPNIPRNEQDALKRKRIALAASAFLLDWEIHRG
jgi:hypothetical protein